MQPLNELPVIEIPDPERTRASYRESALREGRGAWLGRKWERFSISLAQSLKERKAASYALTGACLFTVLVIIGISYLLFMQVGSLILNGEFEDFQFQHSSFKGDKGRTFALEPLIGGCSLLAVFIAGAFCLSLCLCSKQIQEEIRRRVRADGSP